MSRALALILLLAGCRYDQTFVVVHVDTSAAGSLTALRCLVEQPTGAKGSVDVTPRGALEAQTSFSIQLPPTITGSSTLTVVGVNGAMAVGRGITMVNIKGVGVFGAAVALQPIKPIPLHCESATKDGNETDVDCGGECPPCDAFQGCSVAADCLTGGCVAQKQCAPASGPPSWLAGPKMPIPLANVAVAASGDSIYVLDGYSGIPLHNVYVLSTGATVAWGTGAAAPEDNHILGVAFADNNGVLYRVGGQTDKVEATAFSYDPVKMAWAMVMPLHDALKQFSITLGPDGQSYAIAGSNGGGPVVTTQVFSPTTHAWSESAPLITALQDEASGLGNDGRIYAFGGRETGGAATTGDTISFAPGETLWRPETFALSQPRTNLGGVAAGDGRVYAVAGDNGASDTAAVYQNVEALDAKLGAWTPVKSLTYARSQHGVALGSDGRIYAIGGVDNEGNYLDSVEIYGPILTLAANMTSPGGTVMFTGTNFAANANVVLTLTSDKTPQVDSVTSDADGNITGTLTVGGGVASGSYRVRAVDSRSGFPVSTPLAVVAN